MSDSLFSGNEEQKSDENSSEFFVTEHGKKINRKFADQRRQLNNLETATKERIDELIASYYNTKDLMTNLMLGIGLIVAISVAGLLTDIWLAKTTTYNDLLERVVRIEADSVCIPKK